MFRSLAAVKRHIKEKERAEEENYDNQQQDDQAGEANEHIPEAIPLVDVGMHMAQFQTSIGQENKQQPPVQTIHNGDQSNLGNSQIKRQRPRKLQGPKIESETRDGDNLDRHQQLVADHPGHEKAAKEDHHQQPAAADSGQQEAARELPKLNQWILQQRVPPNNNGKPISLEKENENGDKLESFEMGLRKDKELASSSSNSESDHLRSLRRNKRF
ncbi:hypothetical protein COLO4_29090 [Corchorus olitorius]|uniref:Uncharacterized protein n=1 Tax=Corchorus olitorius TaxID=93759 RepID=A0A1R3HGE2_9ROSI|nr:hypothetical protein COLO4_29090 [Corchorus olitorius]